MRVLVTGSAGFVGSRLVRALRRVGHSAFGIDLREPDSTAGALRADLTDVSSAEVPRFDLCFHLASRVGGFLRNSESLDLVTTECTLVERVTRLCREVGCRRLVYTSSIAVFEAGGAFQHGPLELAAPPRTPYARAKAAAERLVAAAFDDFVIVRPTNVFGAAQPRAGERAGESHVIPDLLHKLDAPERTLEVLGDGRQVRNFVHVDDVVRFLMAVMREPERGWFNVRSDIQLTIGALAEELMHLTARRRDIVFRPEFLRYEPRPITRFDLGPSLALGWRPHITSLAEGLRCPIPEPVPPPPRRRHATHRAVL